MLFGASYESIIHPIWGSVDFFFVSYHFERNNDFWYAKVLMYWW